MLRFLAVPAACLALAAPALARDPLPGARPAKGSAAPRYVSLPPETGLDAGGAVPVGSPSAALPGIPQRPEPRRAEPAAAQATSALKTASEPDKPWCPQERRVGTGAGFCLIN